MQPHDITPTKTCTKCGETKPATTEYFSRRKRNKDGLQVHCKKCVAEYKRAYYKANKKHIIERSREWHAANPKRVTEIKRAYTEKNRERIRERGRAYHTANKEQEAEYARTYYTANRERILKRTRAYYAANKERYAELQRASLTANRERRRSYVRSRYARKLQAEGTHTEADVKAQYKRQKGRCYYCGAKVGKTYDVDHVIPLSRGGSNGPENLVIACPSCNRSKSDKLPHEWVEGGRLL